MIKTACRAAPRQMMKKRKGLTETWETEPDTLKGFLCIVAHGAGRLTRSEERSVNTADAEAHSERPFLRVAHR